MTGDARMFNSINTNGNDGYDSITFGDNGKGKVKGLGKIAIVVGWSCLCLGYKWDVCFGVPSWATLIRESSCNMVRLVYDLAP